MGLRTQQREQYRNNKTMVDSLLRQVCTSCSPVREYVRLFDVTEKTSLHRHGTGRRCSTCGGELRDTIVHFGERGTLEQPLNWKGAAEAARMADVILCLGSSLKVSFCSFLKFNTEYFVFVPTAVCNYLCFIPYLLY